MYIHVYGDAPKLMQHEQCMLESAPFAMIQLEGLRTEQNVAGKMAKANSFYVHVGVRTVFLIAQHFFEHQSQHALVPPLCWVT